MNRWASIRVEHVSEDGLSGEFWSFYYSDDYHALCLDTYLSGTRKSKRHKWTYSQAYHRLGRSGVDHMLDTLREAEAPLPDDVVAEATEKFLTNLRVVRWADRVRQQVV